MCAGLKIDGQGMGLHYISTLQQQLIQYWNVTKNVTDPILPYQERITYLSHLMVLHQGSG